MLLVIRTQKSLYKTNPSKKLLFASLITAGVSIAIVYSYLGFIMGFSPLSFTLILILLGNVILYLISNEIAKKFFFRICQF